MMMTMTRKCKQCDDPIQNKNDEFCCLMCRVRWYKNQNKNET
jgi:hypothetical protein